MVVVFLLLVMYYCYCSCVVDVVAFCFIWCWFVVFAGAFVVLLVLHLYYCCHCSWWFYTLTVVVIVVVIVALSILDHLLLFLPLGIFFVFPNSLDILFQIGVTHVQKIHACTIEICLDWSPPYYEGCGWYLDCSEDVCPSNEKALCHMNDTNKTDPLDVAILQTQIVQLKLWEPKLKEPKRCNKNKVRENKKRNSIRNSLVDFISSNSFTYLIDLVLWIWLESRNVSHFGHIDNSYEVQVVALVSHHMPKMLQLQC